MHQGTNLLHLSEDHITLTFDAGLVESRVLHNVRENLQRTRHVLVEHLGIVCRLLPRRVGVEVAADVLDLLLELRSAALPCALEQHVLDEMRDPGGLLRLLPAPGVDPHADGGRAGGERGLRGDA